MNKKHWTDAELAAGYQAMAQINRELAAEFAPLEEEVAAKIFALEPDEEGE